MVKLVTCLNDYEDSNASSRINASYCASVNSVVSGVSYTGLWPEKDRSVTIVIPKKYNKLAKRSINNRKSWVRRQV